MSLDIYLKALRLADALEFGVLLGDERDAAAEKLRSLHAEVERLRESVPWQEAVPWQGGMTNEELRREWELRLPGVEPTDRELSAFAVGIEAGHKIVWVHDPDVERLREAARMALEFCEFCWRDVSLNDYAEERRTAVEAALREALGDKK